MILLKILAPKVLFSQHLLCRGAELIRPFFPMCERLLHARYQARMRDGHMKEATGSYGQTRTRNKQGTIKQRGSFQSCLYILVPQPDLVYS